jgi:hypothetical protein
LAAIVSLLTVNSPALSQGKKKKKDQAGAAPTVALKSPVIWRDPGPVERLDFANGPGGSRNVPVGPFTFVEEDKGGTNPKIKVVDATGRHWGVKWGSEVRSETFSSRLAWAVGYGVEPNYFVSSGTINGVKGLGRAKKYVSSDGRFTDARFELKQDGVRKQTDKDSWRWAGNPFSGTRELNGLKIMVMLTSNWDPKDQSGSQSNTAIWTNTRTGDVVYVLSDWGATMGKWGGFTSREKWDCEGYAGQSFKFVTGVEGGYVRFGYDGKQQDDIREGIRVSDVRWLMGYLGRISDAQIRDGLKASGATTEEANCLGSALRERITQLKRVAGS